MIAYEENENHEGLDVYRSNGIVRSFDHSLRPRMREAEGDEVMSLGNGLLLAVCVVLVGYLLYALLKAEEF